MKYIFMLFLAATLFSCASDNLEEYYGVLDCQSENVSFSNDIEPIISTNCAVSGCHVAGTGLPQWTSYENISANAQLIKEKTTQGIMPPSFSGRSLTIEQVNKIACWADAGAPDN